MSSLASMVSCMHICIPIQRHIHINNKKTFLIKHVDKYFNYPSTWEADIYEVEASLAYI